MKVVLVSRIIRKLFTEADTYERFGPYDDADTSTISRDIGLIMERDRNQGNEIGRSWFFEPWEQNRWR